MTRDQEVKALLGTLVVTIGLWTVYESSKTAVAVDNIQEKIDVSGDTVTRVISGYKGGDLTYVFDFKAQTYSQTYRGVTVPHRFKDAELAGTDTSQIYQIVCASPSAKTDSYFHAKYCM